MVVGADNEPLSQATRARPRNEVGAGPPLRALRACRNSKCVTGSVTPTCSLRSPRGAGVAPFSRATFAAPRMEYACLACLLPRRPHWLTLSSPSQPGRASPSLCCSVRGRTDAAPERDGCSARAEHGRAVDWPPLMRPVARNHILW